MHTTLKIYFLFLTVFSIDISSYQLFCSNRSACVHEQSDMFVKVHHSIVHNSSKMETMKISTDSKMDKLCVYIVEFNK